MSSVKLLCSLVFGALLPPEFSSVFLIFLIRLVFCPVPKKPIFCRFHSGPSLPSPSTDSPWMTLSSPMTLPCPSSHECWRHSVLPSPLQTHLISCLLAVSVSIDVSNSHIPSKAELIIPSLPPAAPRPAPCSLGEVRYTTWWHTHEFHDSIQCRAIQRSQKVPAWNTKETKLRSQKIILKEFSS